MQDTLRSTVRTSLQHRGLSSYLHAAEPVIADLEARERAIFADLMAAGQSLGAGASDVHDVLVNAGMAAPPALQVTSNGASLSTAERDQLASIRHDLTGLMERIDGVLG